MTRVLLVDDEPLVLIGMQGMLNWAALGYEVVGTARNGAEALRAVQEKQPDIVVSDIRMPVMDGFALAEACHKDGSALPAFIMLTSYEEFDYVKRSMRLGVVDYLVKIDLTADSLTAALEHARATAEKEKKLRMPSPAPVSLDTFRDRLFLQLYGGLFTDRAVFDRQCAELGVAFKSPRHIVAVGSLQTPDLPTSQLVTLSTGVTRMAAETLPKYRPCRVTAMDLRHFSVLLPLEADEDPEAVLAPILKTAGQILYNYFSTAIYWAVGRPVNDILKISESQHDAFAALPLLHEGEPVAFYHESPNTQLDHRAQVVGQVQQYIRDHLSERLTLNDVAAVFNFSPNYLSQLFAQNSESGFVEFVTATRITAAKELMASTDLKVYEISDKVGFDSAFYFSKVFKKLEGVSPREYMHAGDVRRGRSRQLRAAYRAEDIPRGDRRGQREGQGRDGPLREDTHNYRFHGRERRRSHAGNDQGELRPHQGRSRGDRRQGTRPPTQRPRTEQTAAAGARSIKRRNCVKMQIFDTSLSRSEFSKITRVQKIARVLFTDCYFSILHIRWSN